MSAAYYQITDIEQGADWALYLNFQNTDGTPLNLTGCTIKMQIRSDYGVTPVATLSTATGGITVTSATGGTATVALTATQTTAIAGGNYLYDIKVTNASGTVVRTVEGGAYVSPQVTQ